MASRPTSHAANRAEPKSIGSARARDPLAREVKLLGALLGQVIVEQEGTELFDQVERLRRAAISRRRAGASPAQQTLAEALGGSRLDGVVRAFSLYFLLINLAEEKHRVRTLRRQQRARARAGSLEESVDAAILDLRAAVASRRRAIELRDPYADALGELQVTLLGQLRSLPARAPERRELERLVHLTISGVAAGIQHTG